MESPEETARWSGPDDRPESRLWLLMIIHIIYQLVLMKKINYT